MGQMTLHLGDTVGLYFPQTLSKALVWRSLVREGQEKEVVMKSSALLARVGAVLSIVGAVLILYSASLPFISHRFSSTHEYEWQQIPLPLVFLAALIVLGSSSFILFGKQSRALAWLSLAATILGLLLHLCINSLSQTCFGACNELDTYNDSGFWLALSGFLLSGLGALVMLLVKSAQGTPSQE